MYIRINKKTIMKILLKSILSLILILPLHFVKAQKKKRIIQKTQTSLYPWMHFNLEM